MTRANQHPQPQAAPDRSRRRACPTRLLPVKTATLIVSGTADTDVPHIHSLEYYTKAMVSRQEYLPPLLPMRG